MGLMVPAQHLDQISREVVDLMVTASAPHGDEHAVAGGIAQEPISISVAGRD